MSIISRSSAPTKPRALRRSNMYNGTGNQRIFTSLFAFAGFWARVVLGLVFVGCVSIVLLYAYRYVTSQSFFALKHVVVTGNSHRDDAQLIATSQVRPGQNIFETSIKTIQQRLQNDPWIAEASVRRVMPDRVEIHVREKQACFWIRRNRELYYADRRGQIIGPVEPAKFISLPVLVVDTPDMGAENILDQAVRIIDHKMLPFGLASMSYLRVYEDDVMEILLDSPQMTIMLGIRDLDGNCRRLALVWDDLRQRDELKTVRVLQAFAGKAWATLG
ncbi:MAG: FtsQ-type POTRA domain-containing protein [Desulfoplanes sp.]